MRRVALTGVAVVVGLIVAVGIFKTLSLPADERLSIANWRDLLIAGISLGSIYALIALGYSIVYGILRMINFAHGEVFMVGGLVSYFVRARCTRAASWTGTLDHHRHPVHRGRRRPRSGPPCCSSGWPIARSATRPGSFP